MQSEAVKRDASYNYSESVAYDLSRFDNRRYVREALESEEAVLPELPREHTKAAAKPKAKARPRISAFAVVSYVVLVALFFAIVMNYMVLNEIAVDTARLQSELETLESDNAKLLVEYERAMNVGDLAEKAAEAGMYSPGADQIDYVDISRADEAVVYSDSGESGIFDRIEKFFLTVASYFD